jgi:hypothetical protein
MQPFDAFRLYVTIKLHMTSEGYDFHKYCGKVRSVTPASFEKRNDKWSFVKLAKLYPHEDQLVSFLASAHAHGSPYIRELLTEDKYQEYYKHHRKVQESLQYTVEQDLRKLLKTYRNPMDMIAVRVGQWPLLAKEHQHGNIELETVCVLGMLLGFFPMWKDKVVDTVLWPAFYLRVTKFAGFLPHFDVADMKQHLSSIITQHRLENP